MRYKFFVFNFNFSAILIIESVAFGVIRIRGEISGLYLCMNKKGHLVARVSFPQITHANIFIHLSFHVN